MDERSRAAQAARRPVRGAPRTPPIRNIEAVLTLGDTSYFSFRGRPYGVPLVPWQVGERLAEIQARAVDHALEMEADARASRADRGAMAAYFDAISELPPILWRNSFPCGRVRRLLRRLGMLRNPFAAATERELMELAAFFLKCRTRSGVSFPLPMDQRRRGMSSTI